MKKITNRFIDIILLIASFFASLVRSFFSLFARGKGIKRSSFFDAIDYVVRIWPHFFWKKPSLFKVSIFMASFIKYVFYNKK